MNLLPVIFTLILWLAAAHSMAQLDVIGVSDKRLEWYEDLDSTNFYKKMKDIRLDYYKAGYLSFNIDSVKLISKDSLTVYVYEGKILKVDKIKYDDKLAIVLEEIGAESLLLGKIFNAAKVSKLMKEILIYYENNGYPFAQVYFNDVKLKESKFNATLEVEEGPKIIFDKLVIKGVNEANQKAIRKKISFTSGGLFNQSLIEEIPDNIARINYIQMVDDPKIELVNNKCNIYLNLKKKNASNFNAVLGVLPNDDGAINITGDVKIKLVNALSKGETFSLNWRKLLPLTQNLNLYVAYPYIFNTDLIASVNFDLYRKDSSFLDLITAVSIGYEWNKNLITNFIYQNRTASVLNAGIYANNSTLPEFADVSKNSYGLSAIFQNLDYEYNPQKGWDIRVSSLIGQKKIKKNVQFPEELYENVALSTLQLDAELEIGRFFKVSKRTSVLLNSKNGIIFNDQIFSNELFRLGGLRTIRGFDEESIFAERYSINSLEFRYLLERNTNAFLFYAQGYTFNEFIEDYPYSFGAGINFQTNAGIFSLTYALGAQNNNPILLRTGKIHFGFINYF